MLTPCWRWLCTPFARGLDEVIPGGGVDLMKNRQLAVESNACTAATKTHLIKLSLTLPPPSQVWFDNTARSENRPTFWNVQLTFTCRLFPPAQNEILNSTLSIKCALEFKHFYSAPFVFTNFSNFGVTCTNLM